MLSRAADLVPRWAVYALWGVLALVLFDPKLSVGGDDATYILLSKAIASGDGLVEIWTPGRPAHTQYPFLFPLLLSPLSLLGVSAPWLKVVPLVAAAMSLLLSRQLFGDKRVVALLAVNPIFLACSRWVLSELPFLAFASLSFVAMQRWERSERRRDFLLGLVAAVAALHVRTAGVALVGGIVAWLLLQRRLRAAVGFAFASATLSLPWWLRNQSYPGGGYGSVIALIDPYRPDLGTISAGDLVERVGRNASLYFFEHLPKLVAPGLSHWLLSVVLLAVLALAFKHGARAHDCFIVCTFVMLLLYPSAWADARMLLPLLPFLLATLLRVVPSWLLFIPALVTTASDIPANLRMLTAYAEGDVHAGYPPAYRHFFTAAAWVGEHTEERTVVVSRKPSLFALTSGRRAFCYPFSTDTKRVTNALLSADIVMIEPLSQTGELYLRPAIEALSTEVLFETADPPTYAIRVREAASPR